MRTRLPFMVLLAVLFACSDDGIRPPDAIEDIQPVLTFPDARQVGSSSLTRTESEVSFTLETSDLEPGTAVSLWVVVFNEPTSCATRPCQDPDLFEPTVMADVVGSTGVVVDPSGNGVFTGARSVGDGSNSLLGALGLPSPGILDPTTAEIHFVLRSHGPAIPGREDEMIRTFNGGCQHPGPDFPDPLPPELGAPGPNSCVDAQFAVHQP